MLKSFAVRNFKGFKDWISFDLTSSNNYEFNQDCIKDKLVKIGLIYGYNGVGKSNLGLAILDVVAHLTDKMMDKQLYQNYQNANSVEEPAEFVFVFQFGENIVEYRYGKMKVDSLVYENLTINEKCVVFFDRKNNVELTTSLEGTSILNKSIADLKISAVKYIKSNSVLPPTPENMIFYQFIDFVERILMFWSLDSKSYIGYESGSGDIIQDIVSKNHVDDFKKFLSDIGLKNNIKVIEIANKNRFLYDFGNTSIDFFSSTSTGIRSLTLFYYWYQRMLGDGVKPSLIFIDEYDAFYHSKMAEMVVTMLKNIDVQVILTTHNTSLMSNELMRPDCCYFMYEDKISPLSKRTDKELRSAHNIEKMYKAGVFNE